jgi:polysaccharide pyruvyl transferase WcaK-like protein
LVIFGTGFRSATSLLDNEQAARFRGMMQRAALCGVRGYQSQQHCLVNGVANVEVIGDPGLSFQPVDVNPAAGEYTVGVMVRAMGKTGEPQYVSNERMFEIVAELADHVISELDATLYFFSLAENIHDSDREGAGAVIERMNFGGDDRVRFLATGEDPIEAFSKVASMDYVISQRLHPTVIAWQQAKPSVAFDYQFHKTADFMGSIGMDEYVLRTDEYSKDLYLAKYDRLMEERSSLAERARRAVVYWSERQLDFARRALTLIR